MSEPEREDEAPLPLRGPLGEVLVALAFFTRLPVRAPDAPLARAAWAFPVAGALVGAAGGLAYAAALWLGLTPWLAALAAVGATILATGGLHEDGAADTADGLGARGERDDRLAAMRDSRLGTFGGLALVLSVAARVGAVAALAGSWPAAGALIAAGAVSRAVIVPVMHGVPPARKDGLAASAGIPGANAAAAALGIAAAVALVAVGPITAIVALLAGGGAAWALAGLARARLGGQTGDVLGAVQQAAEVAVLLAVVCLA